MLMQVHQGLGMSKLATDVGGLQRLLTNVKSRGIFGEVQLAGLLEQVFAPDQYADNIATIPGSSERVEFMCFPAAAMTAWYGCRSMQPRGKITSVCWTRKSVPTVTMRAVPAMHWSGGCARRPSVFAVNMWPHRTPPNLPFCFCPPKACMPKSCASRPV